MVFRNLPPINREVFLFMKGFTKFSNKVLYDNNLQPISKLVYAMLCSYDRGRGCFAKKATLSKMSGCSLYHLRLALNELEDQELIVIHRRKKGMTDLISVVKPSDDGDETISSPTYKKKIKLKVDVLPKDEVKIAKKTEAPPPDKENEPAATEKTPEIPPETPKDIEPIQEYLEETETLTEDLARSMRKVAFSTFIDGKVCISYADKEKMSIKCVDNHTQYWLSTSYRGLVERITGKECEFVRD